MFFTISNKILAPGDRSTPWLLQYSKHLNYKPIKYLCSINNSSLPETTPPDYQFKYIDINSVDSKGRRVSSESLFFRDAPSRARRIVRNEDVIISTVRTYLKAISYIEEVENKLVCSTGFAVMTPGSEVFPKFLFYWACSDWFVNEIVARSVGVSYPAINAIEIGNLPFPVINVKEQQAIADYLDQETTKIDQLVEKKKRLIELLEEQRTAIITHAVTKGLNPGVEMKDSGVEWLGEIPAHWDVKRLKYVLLKNGGGVWGDDDDGNGMIVLRSTEQTIDGKWNIETPAKRLLTATEQYKYKLAQGDLLLTKSSGSELHIGKTTIVTKEIAGMACCFSNFMQRIRPINCASSKYIYYILNSILGREQMVYLSNTTTGLANLNGNIIGSIFTAMPSLEEQQAIADYLDKETTRIDNLINKIHQAIEKLQEYRSALITTAVTGKIDVRQHVS
ncbi:MAG: restriction endonuclease subunit S [Kiritimatiellae bacterium]|nr:restriction endonuclease subunit S [Kiritimatiellia bacterium]